MSQYLHVIPVNGNEDGRKARGDRTHVRKEVDTEVAQRAPEEEGMPRTEAFSMLHAEENPRRSDMGEDIHTFLVLEDSMEGDMDLAGHHT
jgi:hypothetical protein